ncbi:hypothetical protein WJX72_003500 [[Myrmecia] bisecta]|uniref:Uncharacterized protein n=1 Tax=[Myrmecia] bisecta TaxID=41462 RepID=A0AAW1QQK7_9CHLO
MARKCSHCGQSGHNARTCLEVAGRVFPPTIQLPALQQHAGPPDGLLAQASPDATQDEMDVTSAGFERAEAAAGQSSDSATQAKRDRKKGVPWTEEEHRVFLLGLKKLGKGDWRGISRHFVRTRTPTQVASHAQKYFIRQGNLHKRKRRSSLFDLAPEGGGLDGISDDEALPFSSYPRFGLGGQGLDPYAMQRLLEAGAAAGLNPAMLSAITTAALQGNAAFPGGMAAGLSAAPLLNMFSSFQQAAQLAAEQPQQPEALTAMNSGRNPFTGLGDYAALQQHATAAAFAAALQRQQQQQQQQQAALAMAAMSAVGGGPSPWGFPAYDSMQRTGLPCMPPPTSVPSSFDATGRWQSPTVAPLRQEHAGYERSSQQQQQPEGYQSRPQAPCGQPCASEPQAHAAQLGPRSQATEHSMAAEGSHHEGDDDSTQKLYRPKANRLSAVPSNGFTPLPFMSEPVASCSLRSDWSRQSDVDAHNTRYLPHDAVSLMHSGDRLPSMGASLGTGCSFTRFNSSSSAGGASNGSGRSKSGNLTG